MNDLAFGVASPGVESKKEWVELARAAEDLGYGTLYVNDHLHQPLSPLPSLVSAADATSTLRVGTYVLDLDLRNPHVLANELATVDVLSDGRLTVGLGAGWLPSDYENAGSKMQPGNVRVANFKRRFRTLRDLLSGEAVEIRGDDGAVLTAQRRTPVTQSPRPPIFVGAAKPVMLAFGAREADGVSITPDLLNADDLEAGTAACLDKKIEIVRRAGAARSSGPTIDLVVWECMVTPRPGRVIETLAKSLGIDPKAVLTMPWLFLGTPGDIAETIRERRERWGITAVTVPATAVRAFAPVLELLK